MHLQCVLQWNFLSTLNRRKSYFVTHLDFTCAQCKDHFQTAHLHSDSIIQHRLQLFIRTSWHYKSRQKESFRSVSNALGKQSEVYSSITIQYDGCYEPVYFKPPNNLFQNLKETEVVSVARSNQERMLPQHNQTVTVSLDNIVIFRELVTYS